MATAQSFLLSHGVALPMEGFVDARVLAAGVEETHTVPAGADIVLFSATADFYMRADATAAVPSDTTDGTASQLNPTIRDCSAVTAIHLISGVACIVTMEFFTKPD